MKPDEEVRMFDAIDVITNNCVDQLCRERDLRTELRNMTEGMSEEDRVRLLQILADYAFHKLSMNTNVPKSARISLQKAHTYFAQMLKINDWENRRDDLMAAWDDLEDEWCDLTSDMPDLVDDTES